MVEGVRGVAMRKHGAITKKKLFCRILRRGSLISVAAAPPRKLV